MKSFDPPPLARLRTLLHDVAPSPADAAAAPPLPATLLDLAEVQAAAAAAGERDLVDACENAIQRGAAEVPSPRALEQEAAERFALLSTAIDDLPIAQQVELLDRTGRVVEMLAAACGSKAARRLGGRLRRAAGDRELARRLEARLGRRGVEAVETANFVLL